ncbi:hypothetical protein C5167_043999 [Papaver somniferum]|uniref:Uncharacterized protein n=1 Tax=Papaver somniferum TaxID=3469 RepID=A0A4Y7LB71_PAPSO|nr:hypothetical protein C5167_043999 [Papaver somniferum]
MIIGNTGCIQIELNLDELLLMLLDVTRRSDDNMIRRVVVGAIVNLANGVQHHCQPSTISLYSTIDGKNVAYLST